MKNGVPRLRAHPAWLVDKHHQNPYNEETKRILKIFADMGIESSKGNNIIPAGNALKYLSEYFPRPETLDLSVPCGQMPYTSRLGEINRVSISPNGDLVLCSFTAGNIYENDIITLLDGYDPYKDPATRALLDGGVEKLLEYAKGLGVTVDTGDCHSACGICHTIMAVLKQSKRC